MKNFSIKFKLFFILLSFWLLITSNFSHINLFIGFFTSILVTLACKDILYDKKGLFFNNINFSTILKYLFNLLFEIYKSSFSYIIRIIKKDCEPFIVEVELDVTDPLIISIISNSITLTPGTLTIDVDENKLIILTLKDCDDCAKFIEKEIKEKFESFFIEKG